MLPINDVALSSLLSNQSESRLVQIVNINGQPTLQIINPTSLGTVLPSGQHIGGFIFLMI